MLQTSTRQLQPAIPAGPTDRLAPVEPLGVNMRLEADKPLFWEGDKADYTYKIISGAIRVCKLMPDGRRQVSDFFLPGDLIGFDFAGVHNVTAEAIVESIVRRYPKQSIERVVRDNPVMARDMLTLAYDRLATAQVHMVTLGRKNAAERIASFLVTHAHRSTAARRPGQSVALPMSRGDIADHLGLTVETVSRVLSRLRHDRVIDLPDFHTVVVRSWEALDGIAEGGEAA
jgi:CRP-like cAMP-binding protein